MNTALKKINARVKVLQKKHPNSKRKTLQKQAGKEWRDGKLKAKRKKVGAVKKTVPKRKPRKRAAASKKSLTKLLNKHFPKKKRVYKAKRTKVKSYTATRYKRVSGIGAMSSLIPIALLGVGGLLAWKLLSTPTAPAQLVQTSNAQRNAAANNLLSYATLIGMSLAGITKLIESINKSDDDAVISAGNDPANALQSGSFEQD